MAATSLYRCFFHLPSTHPHSPPLKTPTSFPILTIQNPNANPNLNLSVTTPNFRRLHAVGGGGGRSSSSGTKEGKLLQEGVITEALPNCMFRVKLDGGDVILGYMGGKLRKNKIWVMPGNRVRLELNRYDSSKARIVYKLRMTMEGGDQKDLETPSGSRNWSSLPEDLLDNILKRLSLTHFLRCGSVCKSWRHAMFARHRLTCPPLLLQMSDGNKVDKESDDISSNPDFYCLFQGKYEKFPFQLHLRDSYATIPCCGPSEGWLVVADWEYFLIDGYISKFLLNMFSGERVYFPLGNIYNVAFSSSPTSDDCTIVAYTYGGNIVTRKGGKKIWNEFDNPYPDERVCAMTFHRGKLYLLFESGKCRVYAMDEAGLRLVDVVVLHDGVALYDNYLKLVETGDELLMVACQNPLRGFPREFTVYRLDSEGEVKRWVKIKSLGDQSLFLSKRMAQSFSVKEFIYSDFRSNCIYFHWEGQSYVQVYSMEDGGCRNWHIPFDVPKIVGFLSQPFW